MAIYTYVKTANITTLLAELKVAYPSDIERVESLPPNIAIHTSREMTVGEQVAIEALVVSHDPRTYQAFTKQKLINIVDQFRDALFDFASENSKMMNDLGYTTEQKAVAVMSMRTKMAPIRTAILELDFYSIWALFDAVERDTILTNDRINAYKARLYSIINS